MVKNRFADVTAVDTVIDLDSKWRRSRHNLDKLNQAKNSISKKYGEKVKQMKSQQNQNNQNDGSQQQASTQSTSSGDSVDKPDPLDLSSLLEKLKEISSSDMSLSELKELRQQTESQISCVTQEINDAEAKRNDVLREIGNLLHESVPISDDEDENSIIRTFGDVNLGKDPGPDDHWKFLSHVDLITMIGGMDCERGSAIAGSRGYFLTGPAIWLQQALIQYALRFSSEREFQPIYTPFWMRKSLMSQVAQLSQFDEELYRVVSSKDNPDSDETTYLIATSEQPIAALHRNEWLSPSSLPIKYAGLSTCFRQEVGSHGRDTRGIFRVHQFEKVEQFVITAPTKSDEAFHEMIKNAEDFYQSLGIPYRVVSIVSGALNNAASIKYDLESWFPGSAAYRELVSVSNCTDYQSRRLQVRFGQTKKMTGQVEYVHMLNGTLSAISRTICALLEVHQSPDGIRIPQALQPFMPDKFKTIIPYLNTTAGVVKQPESNASKSTESGSGNIPSPTHQPPAETSNPPSATQ